MWSKSKYLSLIVLVLEFISDSVVLSYSANKWDDHKSPYSSSHYRRSHRPISRVNNEVTYDSEDITNDFRHSRIGSSDESQYIIKNIQTGSVNLPIGGKAHVSPDHNKTKSYLIKLNSPSALIDADTPTITTKPVKKMIRRKTHKTNMIYINGNDGKKLCLRCPPERTVVAQKFLDGALIDLPPLSTCRNQQLSRNQYELETLFGRKMNFILPHGEHSFIGRIVNRKTGKYEQSCMLKYKVIVRQCGKYFPRNRQLRVKCDMGGIWGSKCTFVCRNGGLLSHNKPVVCGDEIQWVGDEPECYLNRDYSQDINTQAHQPISHATYSNTLRQCKLPLPPENGKFSCDIKNDIEDMDNDLNMSHGTVCRIKCNEKYATPAHLRNYSVFECDNGTWNSTVTNVCRYL